jgi:chromosome segregation ATPase
MSNVEDRLSKITAAIAEREHLLRVRTQLASDLANEDNRVQQLAVELQYERNDVARLTTGVMGFLETILAGDGALEKEKREAAEAEARLREAQGSLDELRRQAAGVDARLAQLVPSQLEAELAAARAAREEALMRSGSTAGVQLQDLAIRIESIDIELVPLADAVVAGDAAFQALAEILAILDGVATQRVQLNDHKAKAMAGDAQAKVLSFHRALGEIATAPFEDRIALDPTDATFADAWVKGLFGKGTREERIAKARTPMVARIERIGSLLAPLRARHDELAGRRAALLAERQKLVG